MPYHSPISDRNPEPNNRQLLLVFGLFISGGVLLIMAAFFVINQAINFIPVSLEQQLGRLIVGEFKSAERDVQIEAKLNQIVDQLEAKLPANSDEKRDYQVIHVAEDTVNALAIPGDTIIVYQGLLDQVESENELVMILGHEIGHFAHRDHLRRLGNVLLFQLALNYLFAPGSILQSGGELANVVVNAQYSQSQESAADKFGLRLLNQYYGHVAGATDFFERLNKEKNSSSNIAFLSSHPVPDQRIKRLHQQIKKEGYTIGQKVDLNLKD